jgi:hypothetical protein
LLELNPELFFEMADYEHGDYNWSDDIGTDDFTYGLEGRCESLTYEQMTEGLDYEDVTVVETFSSSPPQNLETQSLSNLYEYLTSTSQSCFFIIYQTAILASGFVERVDGDYKINVHMDDYTTITTSDPREAIDTVLCVAGNTPLSLRQCPLNYIYIAGCDKSWSRVLQELNNIKYRGH